MAEYEETGNLWIALAVLMAVSTFFRLLQGVERGDYATSGFVAILFLCWGWFLAVLEHRLGEKTDTIEAYREIVRELKEKKKHGEKTAEEAEPKEGEPEQKLPPSRQSERQTDQETGEEEGLDDEATEGEGTRAERPLVRLPEDARQKNQG